MTTETFISMSRDDLIVIRASAMRINQLALELPAKRLHDFAEEANVIVQLIDNQLKKTAS